jgi:hypothetical protein
MSRFDLRLFALETVKWRGHLSKTGILNSGDVSIPFVALLLISLDMTGSACLNPGVSGSLP